MGHSSHEDPHKDAKSTAQAKLNLCQLKIRKPKQERSVAIQAVPS